MNIRDYKKEILIHEIITEKKKRVKIRKIKGKKLKKIDNDQKIEIEIYKQSYQIYSDKQGERRCGNGYYDDF